jgi:MacB-like periplasmic core domain
MRLEWLRRLFQPNRLNDDIDVEIRFHLAQEAQLRLDRGEAPDRAHAGAQRDFGNVLLIKETTRDMWGRKWVDDFARDARYALRGLKRSPALAVVAILSLAFSIGANTAIFSLADAVLFRSLPARESERLMQVRAVHAAGARQTFSFPLYRDFRDGNQAFESTAAAMAGTSSEPVSIEISGSSRYTQARMTVVTGNYFSTLGVGTARGRTLTLDDDRVRSGHPVAVISHGFWRETPRERGRDSRCAPLPQRHCLHDRRRRE